MGIRCVYTDLDGTLLGRGASLFRDADGNFTLLPARALEACHRAGVEVVLKSGRRKASVMEDAKLLGLSSYAQEHFAAEESVMEETAYPATDSHVAEHRAFAAKVQEFTQASEIGDTGVSLEVVSYLGEWLQHHLSVTDHALGVHLHANLVH